MKKSMKTLAACLFALFAQLALAQGTAASGQAARVAVQKLGPSSVMPMGLPVQCDATKRRCDVPIELLPAVATDGTTVVCIARVPSQITFPGTKDNRRPDGRPKLAKNIVWKLVWNLDPSKKDEHLPEWMKPYFDENYGILVLRNEKNQLRYGGTGDDDKDESNTLFHRRNDHVELDPDIRYVPIIWYDTTDAAGKKIPNLCGATDPKIVND